MTDHTTTLARRLANRYADIADAKPGKGQQIASTFFDGMCEAVHALGFGMTPTAVHFIVKDAVVEYGQRPATSISNRERKNWELEVTEAITSALTAEVTV